MVNKIVSVDFDSTLQRRDVQDFVKGLIRNGIHVWVVTSRFDDLTTPRHLNKPNKGHNDDLWDIVDTVGIPRWKVRFTCMSDKVNYISKTNIIWHLDDDDLELELIKEENISTVGVSVNNGNWQMICENLLKNK